VTMVCKNTPKEHNSKTPPVALKKSHFPPTHPRGVRRVAAQPPWLPCLLTPLPATPFSQFLRGGADAQKESMSPSH
jgi:hypothetical protein